MNAKQYIEDQAPGYQLENIDNHNQQNQQIATLQQLVTELTEKLRILSLATDFDGEWNAIDNTPALSASAPIDKGKFKLIQVPNAEGKVTTSITGTAIEVKQNGYLISGGPTDKYYYQPPAAGVSIPADDSVTLQKLQADLRALLTQLAAMYVDFEDYLHVDAIIDENGLSPWSIDLEGNVLHKGKDVLKIATNAEAMRPLVTELQAGFAKLAPIIAAQVEFPDETLTDAIVDENGLNPWSIDKDGNVLHKGKNVLSIAQAALDLKPEVIALQTTFNQIKTQVSQIIATQVELPDVDGYADAVIDENGLNPWAIDADGNVLHKGVDVLTLAKQVSKTLTDLKPQLDQVLAASVEYPDEVRYLAGDVDENGYAPLLYDRYGNPIFKNRFILKELDDLKALIGSNPELNKYLFSEKDVTCDGDSLTAANYPALLQALFGTTRTVYNRGVGGDTSTQIAFRVGARSVGLSFPNNLIPAAATAVAVTPSNLEIIQKGKTIIVPGKVAGVAGSLTRDADGNYFFTRAAAGAIVITDTVMMFNPDGYAGDEFRTTIICLGRNNYSTPDVVISDVAAIVAYMKTLNKRFLILPVLNGNYSNEFKGGSAYNTIMNLNKTLRETYPRNFADHRQALIRAYDPNNAQDVIDVQNDIVPSSLRVDNIHLTRAGYAIKAQVVKNFLDSNNW